MHIAKVQEPFHIDMGNLQRSESDHYRLYDSLGFNCGWQRVRFGMGPAKPEIKHTQHNPPWRRGYNMYIILQIDGREHGIKIRTRLN